MIKTMHPWLVSALIAGLTSGCIMRNAILAESSSEDSPSLTIPTQGPTLAGHFESLIRTEKLWPEKAPSVCGLRHRGFVSTLYESSGRRLTREEIELFGHQMYPIICGHVAFYGKYYSKLIDDPLSNIIDSVIAGDRTNLGFSAYADKIATAFSIDNLKIGNYTETQLYFAYVMWKYGDLFLWPKVAKLKGLDPNLPVNIFTTKTTPSLEHNNKLNALRNSFNPWESLGYKRSAHITMAQLLYEDRTTLAFVPIIGPLALALNEGVSLYEGRAENGRTLEENNLSAVRFSFLINSAFFILDAIPTFPTVARFINGRTESAYRAISQRLRKFSIKMRQSFL